MQQLTYYVPEIFVVGGIASAAIIALDLRSCRQPMRIMNLVWVLTGLWASLFGLLAYLLIGRAGKCAIRKTTSRQRKMPAMTMEGMEPGAPDDMKGMKMEGMKMNMAEMGSTHPSLRSVVLSTLHCGAGCTLADLIGEWLVFFLPIAVGGSLIAGAWTIDYLLALLFGIGFQYIAIRSMQSTLSRREAMRRAAKADLLSLTAWQAGMYGWMALVIFGWGDGQAPPRNGFEFWFMMQIAMACGFVVAMPVNYALIRMGIKGGM